MSYTSATSDIFKTCCWINNTWLASPWTSSIDCWLQCRKSLLAVHVGQSVPASRIGLRCTRSLVSHSHTCERTWPILRYWSLICSWIYRSRSSSRNWLRLWSSSWSRSCLPWACWLGWLWFHHRDVIWNSKTLSTSNTFKLKKPLSAPSAGSCSLTGSGCSDWDEPLQQEKQKSMNNSVTKDSFTGLSRHF